MSNKFNGKNEICPICKNMYEDEYTKTVYHVTYRPERITFACRGCNYAEFLIRHPEIPTTYFMENRKRAVKEWTLKNRPMIN